MLLFFHFHYSIASVLLKAFVSILQMTHYNFVLALILSHTLSVKMITPQHFLRRLQVFYHFAIIGAAVALMLAAATEVLVVGRGTNGSVWVALTVPELE